MGAVNVWIRRKLKKIVKDMLRNMENVKERRMYAVWEVDLPLLVNQKILCVKKIWVVSVWIRRKLKKIVKDMLRRMENVKERRMYAVWQMHLENDYHGTNFDDSDIQNDSFLAKEQQIFKKP